PRREAEAHDRCVTEAIQAGVPGRQCAIDRVTLLPVVALVVPAAPSDAGSLRGAGISVPDTDPFLSAYLLELEIGIECLGKAECVQPTHDLELGFLVRPGHRLPLQVPG